MARSRAGATYYFLGRPESIRAVVGSSGRFPEDACVVCFDWLTRAAADDAGVAAVAIDEYISFTRGQILDRFIYQLLDTWYLVDGKDLTGFRGISLGSAFYGYLLANHFIFYIKMIDGCLSLFEERSPKAIRTDFAKDSYQFRVLAAIAAVRQIPLEQVGDATDSLLSAALLPDSRSLVSHRLARRLLRILACLARLCRSSFEGRPRVLVGTYFTLVPLLNEWSRRLIPDLQLEFLVCPKRSLALRLALGGHNFALPPEVSLGPSDAKAVAAIQREWHVASRGAQYRSRFVWRGIDISEVFVAALDGIVTNLLPKAAAMAVAGLRYLQERQIRAVVLSTDIGVAEGILVLCAKHRRIPTMILLHGLPLGPCPAYYGPVYKRHADRLVVWSDQLAETFANEFGFPDQELVLSPGYPYLLKYVREQEIPVGDGILVLANTRLNPFAFGGELEPIQYLEHVLGAIAAVCPEHPVLVRPHPGDLLGYYERTIARIRDRFPMLRIRMDGSEPIEDAVKSCRIVVGFNTAVALDAAALGRPYLHVNLNKWEAAPPVDGRSGLRVIRDVTSLRQELTDALTGKSSAYHQWAGQFLLDWAGGIVPDAVRHVEEAIRELVERGVPSKADGSPACCACEAVASDE